MSIRLTLELAVLNQSGEEDVSVSHVDHSDSSLLVLVKVSAVSDVAVRETVALQVVLEGGNVSSPSDLDSRHYLLNHHLLFGLLSGRQVEDDIQSLLLVEVPAEREALLEIEVVVHFES